MSIVQNLCHPLVNDDSYISNKYRIEQMWSMVVITILEFNMSIPIYSNKYQSKLYLQLFNSGIWVN